MTPGGDQLLCGAGRIEWPGQTGRRFPWVVALYPGRVCDADVVVYFPADRVVSAPKYAVRR